MALYWDAGSYQMLDDGQPPAETRTPLSFADSFAYTQGGAGGTGELRRFLDGLKAKGFTDEDFVNGLERYNKDQGLAYTRPTGAVFDNYGYNGNQHVGWWGEQDRMKAIGSGLDALGKPTGWEAAYNPTLAQQQGQMVGQIGTQNQNNTPSDMETLMDVVKFAAIAASMGLGGAALMGGAGAAGGAAGGAGALGEGALASTLAAEGSSGLLGAGLGGAAGGIGSALPTSVLDPAAWAGFDTAVGTGMADSAAAAASAAGGVGSVPSGATTATSGTGGGSNMGDWDFLDLLDGGNSPMPDSMLDPNAWGGFDASQGAGQAVGSLGTPAGTNLLSQIKNLPTSALKSLFGMDDAGAASLASLLGKLGGGLLDYNASTQKADALKEIADRTWGAGQQYRDNASRAMTPGFDLNSIPGYSGALSTGMDAFNRSLSAKNGNPWGQGGAAGEAISWAGKTIGLPAWQNYFNSNSNAGGLSNLATQSTGAAMGAADADSAGYGSLGQTARNIFDPQPNYQKQYLDLLGKQYGLS